MEDLGSLGLRLPRIPPPLKMTTCENCSGLWNFGFEVTKNTPPPPMKTCENCSGGWCVETNRCMPYGYHPVLDVPVYGIESVIIKLCCASNIKFILICVYPKNFDIRSKRPYIQVLWFIYGLIELKHNLTYQTC